jgi:hypothetical protein
MWKVHPCVRMSSSSLGHDRIISTLLAYRSTMSNGLQGRWSRRPERRASLLPLHMGFKRYEGWMGHAMPGAVFTTTLMPALHF